MDPVFAYGKPEMHMMSVSSTSGTPMEANFGLLPNYGRYLINYDRRFQPVEGTLLYVDKTPVLDEDGYLVMDGTSPAVKPDYILESISDTQKGVLARYSIRKVSDSDGT